MKEIRLDIQQKKNYHLVIVLERVDESTWQKVKVIKIIHDPLDVYVCNAKGFRRDDL